MFLSMASACSTSPRASDRSALAMVTRISSGVPPNSLMASCITLAASCWKANQQWSKLHKNFQASIQGDQLLHVLSKGLGNEDNVPCWRVLLPASRFEPETSTQGWDSVVLSTEPRQLLNFISPLFWKGCNVDITGFFFVSFLFVFITASHKDVNIQSVQKNEWLHKFHQHG